MSNYEMPYVRAGDIVYWYAAPRSEPVPAMVTKVNHRNVALAVFHPGMVNHVSLDGVKHLGDPQYAPGETVNQDDGVWDFRVNEEE